MKIPERIEFGNIHRFGKMNSERPRPIIARFLYYSDLDKVKKVFITVLLSEQWFTENNSLSILLTVQLFCLPRLSYAGL
jgi:hypothetical protein